MAKKLEKNIFFKKNFIEVKIETKFKFNFNSNFKIINENCYSSMTGSFFQTLFNLVDTFYAGKNIS